MVGTKEPDKHCSPKAVRISGRSRTVPAFSLSSENEAEPREITVSRKLSNLLPSRTLYYKKSYACTLSPETAQHRSLPRDFSSVNRSLISSEIHRQLSNACHRSKSVVKRRAVLSEPKIEADIGDGDHAQVFLEGESVPYNEEEIAEQLTILRSLPIRLSEKREYRKNIVLANAVPAKGKGAWKVKKAKTKGKIKESFKELFNKLQVWSSSLKFIEGHFGTSVVSYFVFLRWLLFLNLFIFIILLLFIVLPQVCFPVQRRINITTAQTTTPFDSNFIDQFSTSETTSETTSAEFMPRVASKSYQNPDSSLNSYVEQFGSLLNVYFKPKFLDATLYHSRINRTAEERYVISEYCSERYVEQVGNSTKYDVSSVIQDFFQGTGWMELTSMFTGHYLPVELLVSGTGLYYNLPLAFLIVLLALYIICLVMMINYASKGVRETLLSTQSGVQSYSNMVFCGWDYCIENSRTAALKHNSILLELKSTLSEARRKEDVAQWTTLHKARVNFIRFIVNIFVIASLVGTYYLMYYVAEIQFKEQNVAKHEGFSELFIQFLPSITITVINFIMPLIFDVLVRYESYGIQTALNITLVRIIFVRIASIIILVTTFYQQIITCAPKDECGVGTKGCISPTCWETHVGQQMYRLVLMDFFVVIAVTFLWEVPRNFVVRKWRCKLTDMIGRQTFDVPSQVLAIVYGQTLCWLGLFYSPLLPAVCVLKVIITFYIKKFTLIVNCVPSQISYRASRSNAVFVVVLMLNFFITVAILGYSVSNIAPSPGCSPFRYFIYMIDAVEEALKDNWPNFYEVVKSIFSRWVAIPAIIILCLAIYYYLTVTAAHKRMIKVLKSQLVLEGRDKQFLLSRLTEVACQAMAKSD